VAEFLGELALILLQNGDFVGAVALRVSVLRPALRLADELGSGSEL
jgi:hypothetical protein